MKKALLDHLACPACRGSLKVRSNGHSPESSIHFERGEIQCSTCGVTYGMVNAIPRFVDSQSYASSFGKEWTTFSRTQLDSANGTRISHHRFQQLSPIDPQELRGKRVLEVGCGMGRFLEVVAKHGAEAFGVDLSQAVESAAKNLERFENVFIAQADLFNLPFRPQSFDYVYSFGVIHHTPSPREAVFHLSRLVKPGGRLTVWVYGKRGPSWLPRPYGVYGSVLRLLPHDLALKVLKAYAKFALPLGRIPALGYLLGAIFPVQDLKLKKAGQDGYEDERPRMLSRDFILEWAWLNAFDMYTPRYASQHTFAEAEEWLKAAGLVDIKRNQVSVAVTGTKPAGATNN